MNAEASRVGQVWHQDEVAWSATFVVLGASRRSVHHDAVDYDVLVLSADRGARALLDLKEAGSVVWYEHDGDEWESVAGMVRLA